MNKDKAKAIAAVKEIADDNYWGLLRIIQEESRNEVWAAAIARLRISGPDSDRCLRETTDIERLVIIAEKSPNEHYRLSAVDKITNQAILEQLALQETDEYYCANILARIKDDDVILAILSEKKPKVVSRYLQYVKNASTAAKIADAFVSIPSIQFEATTKRFELCDEIDCFSILGGTEADSIKDKATSRLYKIMDSRPLKLLNKENINLLCEQAEKGGLYSAAKNILIRNHVCWQCRLPMEQTNSYWSEHSQTADSHGRSSEFVVFTCMHCGTKVEEMTGRWV
jgi:hypothetical protein